MGGIALIARELGHEVTGVDAGAYPPMSTLLSEQGVSLTEGYTGELPDPPPDCILIGNALSRGNPTVEATMTSGLDYQSGPAWLSREVLSTRTVIAVAGVVGLAATYAGASPGGVKRHAAAIQKYFESGFPHEKSQFISICGTCWASLALMELLPEVK